MKRLLVFLILWLPVYAHAALNVFACEPEWAALAKEIGGDDVKVYAATTAMQDPHRIEARPSLIAQMRRANLVVCTGADLEVGWLPVLLQNANNAAVQPGRPGLSRACKTGRGSTAPKATCMPPATRTSTPTRATSCAWARRWRGGWPNSTRPMPPRTGHAGRPSPCAGRPQSQAGKPAPRH
jgi:hypothetical protein